jgi:hypothetical protein
LPSSSSLVDPVSGYRTDGAYLMITAVQSTVGDICPECRPAAVTAPF